MSVTDHHRAETVVVVDQLVAVDIEELAAVALFQIEGIGVSGLEGRRDTERHRLARSLE
jgi:hypothetical protein